MKQYYEFYQNLSVAYFVGDCKSMFMDKNQYMLLHKSRTAGKEVLVALDDLERIYGPYMDVAVNGDKVHVELKDDAADLEIGSKNVVVKGKTLQMAEPCVSEDGVIYLPAASFMATAFDKCAVYAADGLPFSKRTWNQPGALIAVCDKYEYKEVPGQLVVKAVPREAFSFDNAAVQLMNRVLNGKHDGELNKTYWYPEAKKVMTYSLYVPTGYNPAVPSKMVVALHGGGLGEQFIYSLSQNKVQFWSEKFNYIFMAPNACTKDSTYGNVLDPGGPTMEKPAKDMGDPASDNPYNMSEAEIVSRKLGEKGVLKAIDAVCAEYNIDKTHIFLQGNSMGGLGTFHLGATYPELFRAISPFGIGLNSETALRYNLKNMPIRMVGGTEDHGFERIKATYKQFKEAGYDIEMDIVGGGVHSTSWAFVLEDTFKFYEKNS